ncbi:alpha/beta hydrolase [Microbacterium hatanonis]|uniref:Alpha/beta hydrolase n=2 Tax=Microbacterium hatanonis TaxID=404366 RepID=A0A5C8I510_9MICO|nr:alpha/beta hydrolase [Microbacterium hatanonis]
MRGCEYLEGMQEPSSSIAWATCAVEVRGGVIAAQAAGEPSADPALLFLGGATWSRDGWSDAFCAEFIDAGVRVLRFDARDTGESTISPVGAPAYTSDDLVDDAIAVADAFDVSRIVAVGLSMGGGLAQQLAATHPGRVVGLVLVSTSPADDLVRSLPGPSAEIAATLDAPVAHHDWTDRAAVIDWVVESERPYAGPGTFDEGEMRAVVGRVWDRTPSLESAMTNHFLVAGSAPPVDLSALTSLPSIVVHGSADPLFPLAHGEALAEALDAPLIVLTDVGHQAPPPRTWPSLVPAILGVVRDARDGGDR